jgi:hypothetical protein
MPKLIPGWGATGVEGQDAGRARGCWGGEKCNSRCPDSQGVRPVGPAAPDAVPADRCKGARREQATHVNGDSNEDHFSLLLMAGVEGDGMPGFGGEPDDRCRGDEDRGEELEQVHCGDRDCLTVD